MANKLVFQADFDASGVERGLKLAEARAEASMGRMNAIAYRNRGGALSESQIQARADYEAKIKAKAQRRADREASMSAMQGPDLDGTMRQAAMMAGGKRGGAMMARQMFISAGRDAFASLASGQSPLTVFMQQAPQVAQAFTMMGSSALDFAKKIALMPITWVLAGFGALVTAAYFIIKAFDDLAKVQLNLRNLTNLTNLTFKEQVRILQESWDATRKQVEWSRAHAAITSDLASETDKLLTKLRERHLLERQMASGRGASPQHMAQLEADQMREELSLLEKQIQVRQKAYDDAMAQSKAASDQQDEFFGLGDKHALEAAKKNVEEITAVMDALKEKMKSESVLEWVGTGSWAYKKARAGNAQDRFSVTVGGRDYKLSLSEAQEKLHAMLILQNQLASKEKEIADLVERRNSLTDKEKQDLSTLVKQRDELKDKLGIHEEFSGRIRGAKAASISRSSDSLVAIGNFLGTGRGAIENLAQRQTDLMQTYLPQLSAIARSTARMASGSGGGDYPIS